MENYLPLSQLISIEDSPSELLQNSEYDKSSKGLFVPIGITDAGELMVQDISKIPHMLICGMCGSGKTAFVQNMITALINRYTPKQIQFMIYAQIPGEYSHFKSSASLLTPIIWDEGELYKAMRWLAEESKRRLTVIAEKYTRSIDTYNKNASYFSQTIDVLSHIFFIVEEQALSSLPKAERLTLFKLFRNSRTCGIHFIVTSSFYDSKFIKKELLPQILCRVSFQTQFPEHSALIYGRKGAEELVYHEELLFTLQGPPKKLKAVFIPFDMQQEVLALAGQRDGTQPHYIDLEPHYPDLDSSTKAIHSQSLSAHLSDTPDSIINTPDGNTNTPDIDREGPFANYDELLPEAVENTLDAGEVAVSMLQRRLKIGYSRAARIIDQMEELGIIGPYEGPKPRSVRITRELWAEMQRLPDATPHSTQSVSRISSVTQSSVPSPQKETPSVPSASTNNVINPPANQDINNPLADYDSLLPRAVNVAFQTGEVSVSLLQQQLALNNSRAKIIVDQMEDLGIIGPYEGSKPRPVRITRAQWNTIQYPFLSPKDPSDNCPLEAEAGTIALASGAITETTGSSVIASSTSPEAIPSEEAKTESQTIKDSLLRFFKKRNSK